MNINVMLFTDEVSSSCWSYKGCWDIKSFNDCARLYSSADFNSW